MIRVTEILYFDDLDPTCLTGDINFTAPGFDKLWVYCAAHRLTTVADVHTHPGSRVAQSTIDAANPMISTVGHIAIIVPNYAADQPPVHELGVHIHRGDCRWDSAFGDAATALLLVRPVWKVWSGRAARFWSRAGARLFPHDRKLD